MTVSLEPLDRANLQHDDGERRKCLQDKQGEDRLPACTARHKQERDNASTNEERKDEEPAANPEAERKQPPKLRLAKDQIHRTVPRDLTSDMSGSRKLAKPAGGCPLDGGVRPRTRAVW